METLKGKEEPKDGSDPIRKLIPPNAHLNGWLVKGSLFGRDLGNYSAGR